MSMSKKESFFWASYSDLMTSLFFIMLVLFILTITLLHNKIKATQTQLDKIEEIEQATNRIDSTYFEYNKEYKKHVLTIKPNFGSGEFLEMDIDNNDIVIKDLVKAGQSIRDSIKSISRRFPEIQYLLIIEGQASRDNAPDYYNYQLSYKRAYTLKTIWDNYNIDFGPKCEILISGSGIGGTMREDIESDNQRFLIHILPKPGIIEASKN